MLDMELRVWREKKMLAHHLQGLGEDTLARQVWEQQVAQPMARFQNLGPPWAVVVVGQLEVGPMGVEVPP